MSYLLERKDLEDLIADSLYDGVEKGTLDAIIDRIDHPWRSLYGSLLILVSLVFTKRESLIEYIKTRNKQDFKNNKPNFDKIFNRIECKEVFSDDTRINQTAVTKRVYRG